VEIKIKNALKTQKNVTRINK